METNKNTLREETISFAIEISDICDNIKGCSVYINQLLRCSSSIGANLHEAKYAQSKADFINKLEIALKESFETEYWLELLHRKNRIDETTYKAKKGMTWREWINSEYNIDNIKIEGLNSTISKNGENPGDFLWFDDGSVGGWVRFTQTIDINLKYTFKYTTVMMP